MVFVVVVVEVVAHPPARSETCRPLFTTSFQTPPRVFPGSSATTTTVGAAAVTVAWLGCGATLLLGHAFDICPKAPHHQQ